jgi:hypothetical protein
MPSDNSLWNYSLSPFFLSSLASFLLNHFLCVFVFHLFHFSPLHFTLSLPLYVSFILSRSLYLSIFSFFLQFRHVTEFPSLGALFSVSWGGVRLSPLVTSATTWPFVTGPDDR